VDTYGTNIPEDRRFETLCILAKTANQMPGKLNAYKEVLEKGGTFDDVLNQARSIEAKYGYYDGVKAAELAAAYQGAYADPSVAERLDRANIKVSSETFNPATEAGDEDIAQALRTIGQTPRVDRPNLARGASHDEVKLLQEQLNQLGYTDARGQALKADGVMGPSTRAAMEAFQRDHGLDPDGVLGPKTKAALEEAMQPVASHLQAPLCPTRLDDPGHPDNGFYLRTRDLVYRLDREHGRTPDHRSDQLASALTVQARADGLQRIDQVALSPDASSLWGAQRPPGARDHFFDKLCNVNTVQGMNTPMEQSGAQWPQAVEQFQQHQEQAQRQVQDEVMQRSVSGMRMQ
jgi:peptidoglycan hydrolase-like protein with peptidoglycan-binding domain